MHRDECSWWSMRADYNDIFDRSVKIDETMDKLQQLYDVAADMHTVILNLYYRAFIKIHAYLEADRQKCIDEGEGPDDYEEEWREDGYCFVRDVLACFFWHTRANLQLGPLTLTPETGAMVVYEKK